MPKYTIACYWTVMGQHEVEAENQEAALDMVADLPLPPISVDYLEGSFEMEVNTNDGEEPEFIK